MTTEQLQEAHQQKKLRLISIADISCDLTGSLEFMDKVTTIEVPFFYVDPSTGKHCSNPSVNNHSIQIMSIDNLPTQFPKDASEHFGNALAPFISNLLNVFIFILN